MSPRVDPDLLAILVCPKCESELRLQLAQGGDEESLDCLACQLSFPVEDGIPVMLVEEALPADAREA